MFNWLGGEGRTSAVFFLVLWRVIPPYMPKSWTFKRRLITMVRSRFSIACAHTTRSLHLACLRPERGVPLVSCLMIGRQPVGGDRCARRCLAGCAGRSRSTSAWAPFSGPASLFLKSACAELSPSSWCLASPRLSTLSLSLLTHRRSTAYSSIASLTRRCIRPDWRGRATSRCRRPRAPTR
jgi:hypothetical protein